MAELSTLTANTLTTEVDNQASERVALGLAVMCTLTEVKCYPHRYLRIAQALIDFGSGND